MALRRSVMTSGVGGGDERMVTDGLHSSNIPFCLQTTTGANPWIMVDLDLPFSIASVVVINTYDQTLCECSIQ